MRGPSVSVVVPAYQARRWVAEAVASAVGQSHPPLEVLVVDDGSTDGTGDAAAAVGASVRVLRQPNRGVAAARNRGLAEARGDWVAFLDADDAWEPTKLERQLGAAGPEVVGVHCGALLVDAEGDALGERDDGRGGDVLLDLVTFRRPVVVTGGSGLLAPTEVVRSEGGFHEALSTSADWDLYWRLAARGPLAYVDAPLVRYRIHGGNMHRDVALFREDMRKALGRALADPRVGARGPFVARRGWSGHFRILSGAAAQAGDWGGALRWGLRSLVAWPPAALELARGLARRRPGLR